MSDSASDAKATRAALTNHSPNSSSAAGPVLFGVLGLGLVLVFLFLVGHHLGAPFQRDYDEGVYWQSLRLMAQGHGLYSEIFCSQAPLFLGGLYPLYHLLGGSLFAARAGVVLVSLLGLGGAALAGAVIRGRIGALLGFGLMAVNSFFVFATRTLQADAPCASLTVLAVGLAYQWWRIPTGVRGYILAILTGLMLAASIMTKLLGLAACIPVLLLALGHLRRARVQAPGSTLSYSAPILAGLGGLVIGIGLSILPFRHDLAPLWDQVIRFHMAAKAVVQRPVAQSLHTLVSFAVKTPLVLLAAIGFVIAIVRRDWLMLPLFGWGLALLGLCIQQAPLFHQHLVTFIPVLALLSIPAIYPIIERREPVLSAEGVRWGMLGLYAAFVLVIGLAVYKDGQNYRYSERPSQADLALERDLDSTTSPSDLVITDLQTLVGFADRSTASVLVDTSFVRIQSGYLRLEQLSSSLADPAVRAVVIGGGRLPTMRGFPEWLHMNFIQAVDEGGGREIWLRK
jgi:hypothetical protein